MLTTTDTRRLTLWKWRYTAESLGFTRKEAESLLFLKWLYTTGRMK